MSWIEVENPSAQASSAAPAPPVPSPEVIDSSTMAATAVDTVVPSALAAAAAAEKADSTGGSTPALAGGGGDSSDNALPPCVQRLPSAPGTAETFIVGTAHVSAKSVGEVQDAIAALRPDVVLLEICSGRQPLLEMQSNAVPTLAELANQLKAGVDTFSVLYSWFLASVADKLEVMPGAEFAAGFTAAAKLSEGAALFRDPTAASTGAAAAPAPATTLEVSAVEALARARHFLVCADTAYREDEVAPPSPPPSGSPEELPAAAAAAAWSAEQRLWMQLLQARSGVACPVVLADRHITATVRRLWGSLTPWEKLRLGCSMLMDGLSLPEDMGEMVEELKGDASTGGEDMLTEAILELRCV
jgi:hypothetical protein